MSNIETFDSISGQAVGPNSIPFDSIKDIKLTALPHEVHQEIQTHQRFSLASIQPLSREEEAVEQTVHQYVEQQSSEQSKDAPQSQLPDDSNDSFEIPLPKVPLGPQLQIPEHNQALPSQSLPPQFEQAFELQPNPTQSSTDPLNNEQSNLESSIENLQGNQHSISVSQQQILTNVVSQSINGQQGDSNESIENAPGANAEQQSVQPLFEVSPSLQDRFADAEAPIFSGQSQENSPSNPIPIASAFANENAALSIEIPQPTEVPAPFSTQPKLDATPLDIPQHQLDPYANGLSYTQGYSYHSPPSK